MPQIVYRSNFVPKYSHAYNEYGNYLSFDSALKIELTHSGKWYLDKNKEVELIISAIKSEKVTAHWKAKSNQFITTADGIKRSYNADLHSESFEHINFKSKIIEKEYFIYKEYKVLIKDAFPEFVFSKNRYRTDIKAKLYDETPVFIEVIKTSDLSDKKTSEINETQILTFKLYIDEYGNQEHNKSAIIGNEKIERIEESIRKGIGSIAEVKEQIEQLERTLFSESKRKVHEVDFRILRIKEWLVGRIKELRSTIRNTKDPVSDFGNRIESVKREIRSVELSIQEELKNHAIFERKIAEIYREVEQAEKDKQSTLRSNNRKIYYFIECK